MAQHPQRVIRAYSLTVEIFDHLKATQRQLQSVADQRHGSPATEGAEHWVTNSDALSRIIYVNRLLTGVADRAGITLDDLVTSLAIDGFAPSKSVEPGAAASMLPPDVRDHLSAYRQARGLTSDAAGLLEIIHTHMLLAEISEREGHSMNTIAESTRIANEWHREGIRGTPVRTRDALGSVAH